MRYTKAINLYDPIIRQALDQGNLKLQSGQWVRLGDSPRLSRFHSIDLNNGIITAFHYPRHVSQYQSYVEAMKA